MGKSLKISLIVDQVETLTSVRRRLEREGLIHYAAHEGLQTVDTLETRFQATQKIAEHLLSHYAQASLVTPSNSIRVSKVMPTENP